MATQLQTNYTTFLPLVSRVHGDAKVFPVPTIDFSLDTQFVIDLTAPIQSAQLANGIQGCFIDGSQAVYGPMQMQVFGTGQIISIPSGAQGYFPLLCTQNSYTFVFSNANGIGHSGQATYTVYFVNIPVVQGMWNGVSAAGGGYGN